MFEELLLDGANILNKVLASSMSAIGEQGQYFREYALTKQGDPICLNEYATGLSTDRPNIYVVLTEDYSTGMGETLTKDYINKDAEFDEFLLPSREGRRRLSYI